MCQPEEGVAIPLQNPPRGRRLLTEIFQDDISYGPRREEPGCTKQNFTLMIFDIDFDNTYRTGLYFDEHVIEPLHWNLLAARRSAATETREASI
jgi:hypothetical protein